MRILCQGLPSSLIINACLTPLSPAVSTGKEQINAHDQTHQFMDYPEVGYSKTKADAAKFLLTMFTERNHSSNLPFQYKTKVPL